MEFNANPDVKSCTLWEAAKAYIRGRIISYCSYKRKKEIEE